MLRTMLSLWVAMTTCAAAQTIAPVASKPPLSSNDLTIGDYCTIILAPKVQDALHANDAQRSALSRERDRFELMLNNLTQHTAGRGTTPLLGVARRGLEVEGQRIRDLLTADQDAAFQKLFADKALKPIEIKVASSVPHPGPHPTNVYGAIELLYTRYQENNAETAPATPTAAHVPAAPIAAPASAPPAASVKPASGPPASFDPHAAPLDASLAANIQNILSHKYYQFAPISIGGFSKEIFEDLPAAPGLLVGLRCTTNSAGNAVVSVQPIYLTASGEVLGSVHGNPGGTPVDLVARPGYAVGQFKLRGGGGLDAIILSFMRIKGDVLDPSDAYDSATIGGKGGHPVTVGGNGTPIIGIIGRAQPGSIYLGLSAISLPAVADPATIK